MPPFFRSPPLTVAHVKTLGGNFSRFVVSSGRGHSWKTFLKTKKFFLILPVETLTVGFHQKVSTIFLVAEERRGECDKYEQENQMFTIKI